MSEASIKRPRISNPAIGVIELTIDADESHEQGDGEGFDLKGPSAELIW
jgi:hypothetical protein